MGERVDGYTVETADHAHAREVEALAGVATRDYVLDRIAGPGHEYRPVAGGWEVYPSGYQGIAESAAESVEDYWALIAEQRCGFVSTAEWLEAYQALLPADHRAVTVLIRIETAQDRAALDFLRRSGDERFEHTALVRPSGSTARSSARGSGRAVREVGGWFDTRFADPARRPNLDVDHLEHAIRRAPRQAAEALADLARRVEALEAAAAKGGAR